MESETAEVSHYAGHGDQVVHITDIFFRLHSARIRELCRSPCEVRLQVGDHSGRKTTTDLGIKTQGPLPMTASLFDTSCANS